jgi:hypothetical protein
MDMLAVQLNRLDMDYEGTLNFLSGLHRSIFTFSPYFFNGLPHDRPCLRMPKVASGFARDIRITPKLSLADKVPRRVLDFSLMA